ncbi:peptide chain release factor N(5)-glutamine methyltransferase [Candidatus Hydrogenedentota bacterium]
MTWARVISELEHSLGDAGVENPRLDLEVLAANVLGTTRSGFLARLSEDAAEGEIAELRVLADRRRDREPLAYITGLREFMSLDFEVTPAVLIPRPETELLVENAVEFIAGREDAVVVDLCTGSGCVAISIARMSPGCRVYATDISPDALEVARRNAARLNVGGRIDFAQGDLFEAFAEPSLEGECDLIVSNPPYVSERDMANLAPEILDYEPVGALTAWDGGMEFHKRILMESGRYIAKSGGIMMEISPEQAEELCQFARDAAGFKSVDVLTDLTRRKRIIVAA